MVIKMSFEFNWYFYVPSSVILVTIGLILIYKAHISENNVRKMIKEGYHFVVAPSGRIIDFVEPSRLRNESGEEDKVLFNEPNEDCKKMSLVAFITCLTVSVVFFLFANVYHVFKQIRIHKLIKNSGQTVSTFPMIIFHSSGNDLPSRPDILSPDAVRPPPSYDETIRNEQDTPAILTVEQELPTAPPPYVK